MSTLIHILITAGALVVVSYLLPGIHVVSFQYAILVASVLGLLNIFVKPIIVFLTLPATILTLGLFLFVVNAIIFMIASSLLSGFVVDGFVPALLGSLIVSIISTIGAKVLT